ncbi:MAG: RNA polymerase sigma factor [Bacteroidetes bacterium]|nr:RNA polymerase sigma factor [Bacteroidota bacterium]
MTAIEFNHKLTSLQDNLHYFAMTLTSNSEEAKDLVQDTYIKALTNRDKFEDNTNLKAWAFTIMKNTFINNYRRNIRTNAIIDTTEDLYFLNIPKESGIPSPESQISYKDIMKRVDLLDDDQRIPFVMHTQGYKYKEIAETLHISIGTVKSRIFFGRKKLMENLKGYQNRMN